jgi:F-type H+-transporting ATPase subunit gamma
MAISTRLIKRRIKSIANTRKITKAMELVAASKMRKAVQLTVTSRAYSGTTKKLVDEIRRYVDPGLHAFLSGVREGTGNRTPSTGASTLVIVAASDRGLCGGFNAQLLKKALEFLRSRTGNIIRIMSVGRRAEGAVRRAGYEVMGSFDAISNAPSFAAAMPVGRLAVQEFISGNVDRLFIVYTDFKSAIVQVPTVEQLLPIIPEEELQNSSVGAGLSPARSEPDDGRSLAAPLPEQESTILFEPNPGLVLDQLLPRLIETRIYQALLESSASEHSARMMAMRSATDSATEMLDDLTFTYNQARQAGITREISEISAGKAALE